MEAADGLCGTFAGLSATLSCAVMHGLQRAPCIYMLRLNAVELLMQHGVQVIGSSNLPVPTIRTNSSSYPIFFIKCCRFWPALATAARSCSIISCRPQTRMDT